jgi:CheY-like chemotaxis protein
VPNAERKPKRVVLLVEDESVVRFINAEILSGAGYGVIEVGDAHEAIQALEQHPEVEVLVTDVKMPGWMSGIDLARLAAKQWPNVAILVTSAYYTASDGDLPDGMRFLPKPFQPDRLLAEIDRLMNEREAGD